MQPYFFPYVGYFQLIAAVDAFVFYDDVNFIKNGWINRNRLLVGNSLRYITIPLSGASIHRKINEIQAAGGARWRKKHLETVRQCYAHAPYVAEICELISEAIGTDEVSLGAIAKASIRVVAKYLGLDTRFVESSQVYGNAALRGSERVLDICRQEQATEYLNLPGGRDLYSEHEFLAHGIALRFVEPSVREYRQLGKTFVPGLSILDLLMCNSARAARCHIDPQYTS